MKNNITQIKGFRKAGVLLLCLLFGTVAAAEGRSFPSDRSGGAAEPRREAPAAVGEFLDSSLTVIVEDPDGNPVKGFRWLLEEDNTFYTRPGAQEPETLSVNFHTSYAPVASKGNQARQASTTFPINSGKRYFLSILPSNGYALGGAPVLPGQSSVTVVVQPLPLPTAQITIEVFQDTAPVNGAYDQPQEQPLEGFSIFLEDAGGRYGASAGMQSQDVFGNLLGTTYQYNPDGTPVLVDGAPVIDTLGAGFLVTDAEGKARFRNLAPGKYGIITIPPAGEGWQQTSTIEGTKLIDAWVRADEPPFFAEFGPPGVHVFVGFVQPFTDTDVLDGGATLTGQVVNLHLGKPPESGFFAGGPFPHTTPWVALNSMAAGDGEAIYVARTTGDGNFSIPDVPAGDYQLVVFDDNLDLLIAFQSVTVNPGATTCNNLPSCDFGPVPVHQWFHRLENWVFADENENGFMDPTEGGIPEQAIILRWRDGTIYQELPTDLEGFSPFDQVFPFFSWLVMEIDFARFKATGATIVVDDGGDVEAFKTANPGLTEWTFGDQLVPQDQDIVTAGVQPFRTETGVVLTQAFQGFLGQTNVVFWGKKAYDPGENGGISGVVYYATTRAEDDPATAGAEPWEPGVAGVTVRLYDSSGLTLLNEVTTDNWNESLPTGCLYPTFNYLGTDRDCFDGLRNWNQVRPGTFDGGFAFETMWSPSFGATGATESPLVPGVYIAEVVLPTGYEIVKEEDRNVDFGEEYVPADMLLPPECVGPDHLVPNSFSLFPLFEDDGSVAKPYRAGEMTPLCTRKRVTLNNGLNAAVEFPIFTEVPIAAHVVGGVIDDTANEFDQDSPTFGEKYAPPFLPVSFRDYTGREITRVYTDIFGRFNALLPSTFTNNLPQPSGISPNMLVSCMNDPTLPDGSDDPWFNRKYSTFCYTFQYMPGTTTYLDTPVLPVAAFAGPDQFPVDCEFPDGTPRIGQASVDNGIGGGPFASLNNGQDLTLTSMGTAVDVPNPIYCNDAEPSGCPAGSDLVNAMVQRDYGFGTAAGTVVLLRDGELPIDLTPAAPGDWTETEIDITLPSAIPTWPSSGQIVVTRSDGTSSVQGITLQLGLRNGAAARIVSDGQSIQDAIDIAAANDLILVGPGTYNEHVIMWKPVQLQGWGPGVTTINALSDTAATSLEEWEEKVEELVESGDVDLLPGQGEDEGGESAFFAEQGTGVFVIAPELGSAPNSFDLTDNLGARIDGFTVRSSSMSGGIIVNGYAEGLEIGNNRVANNYGFYSGGIRLGHPILTEEGPGDGEVIYVDAENDDILIHHNHVTQNGAFGGAGGLAIHTGSEYYEVSENYICGNFSTRDGAGIGHLGLSEGGLIDDNWIIFNENFYQGFTISGGGIYIAGGAPPGDDPLTEGSGSVTVNGNLIQGNLAGAGDGGGIRLSRINGQDVVPAPPLLPGPGYHTVLITNNMIVNNIAALAGGGISLQDAPGAVILHNTVANNDSTATAGDAFAPGSPGQSTPQPAGIVSRAHSPALQAALGGPATDFSDPELVNNIIYHNRSFFFDDVNDPPGTLPPDYQLVPAPATPVYSDLGVLGSASGTAALSPVNTVLTDATGTHPSNVTGVDPLFLYEYFNGGRGTSITIPELTTGISVPPAFDEGGNFIRVIFGPLTLHKVAGVNAGDPYGDYHILSASSAHSNGTDLTGTYPFFDPDPDIDGDQRPWGITDIGADEIDDPPPPFRRARSSPPGSSDRVLGEKGGIQWLRLQ